MTPAKAHAAGCDRFAAPAALRLCLARRMGRLFAFANQKGGVGKTTTTVNLGAYLALAGRRVLMVDFDPQANATSSVGLAGSPSIYQAVIGAADVADVIVPTSIPGLSIARGGIELSGASVELANARGREAYLKRVLNGATAPFDDVLIDCPPSLGLLTINALVAATHVVIPLQCEYLALEGLAMLLRTIESVQRRYNRKLIVGGIVFTMYDGRTRLTHEVVREVTGYFRDRVFRTVIPRNVRLAEAPSHALPICQYDPSSIGARSYRQLAEEFVARV